MTVTIGVDLGGTGTRVVALAVDGTVLRTKVFATPARASDQATATLLDAMAAVADGFIVSSVGIGASGPVTPDGIIHNDATLPAFTGLDLVSIIARAHGWSAVIDNDAAAAGVGEHSYGAGRGSRSCLTVTLGTGIGVALTIDGRPVRGGDGMHPEGGHIAVRSAPVACYCGLPRCWEQAASRTALEGMVGGQPGTAADAARAGDTRSAQVFQQYGRAVADGLGTLLTLYKPDVVVLGGSVANYLDLYQAELSDALDRAPDFRWSPPIVAAELGDLAGAVGAAALAERSTG